MNIIDKIWKNLMEWVGNPYGVAGIMGNLYAESALNPINLQNSYEKSLGMTDEQYTAKVDDGSYTNFVNDSAGYGLAQWTYWSRKQGLLALATERKKSIGDLDLQLEYLQKEISANARLLTVLKNAKSVGEASTAVLMQYEKPADQSTSAQLRRAEFGQKYYDEFSRAYYIQLGGFSSKEEAEKALEELKQAGYSGEILTPDIEEPLKVGDIVTAGKVGAKIKNINGIDCTIWHEHYTIMELSDKTAVIGVGGVAFGRFYHDQLTRA